MAPIRRKSQGSIRSPHVKRNVKSQVTLENWLFKLEGGALRQWKQRWCVLVDFCLFFYKAPHEEKVISSILLPSYKINPCSTDDKVSKKYAFKAEHQNMKTYYFAAEDKETMKKWMNAMSLATIMQNSGSAVCEDDDSGFTSYQSCRHPSNRSSSIHNSSSSSEYLKQRSNSCGDRVGEMYLGSDDKYPNLYKSTSSNFSQAQQDFPTKQPLYANAPPKPRRLTQADGSGTYSSDPFDRGVLDGIVVKSHQQSVETCYMNDNSSLQYLPADVDDNSSACLHLSSSYLAADLMSPLCEDFPDAYKVKPPRPRSADFLERENKFLLPRCNPQYCENRQPQRPKSSLECCNRVLDCEDYDFDNYRDAVRVQADNFYANKNLMKNRTLHENQRQTENVINSDSGLNAHYGSCFSSDPVSSSFLQDIPHSGINTNQERGDNFDSLPILKSSPNESMQRLMEWKQRMLQSPLSRQNQLYSAASGNNSFNSLKYVDYSRQSLRNYERNCSLFAQCKNMPYQKLPSVKHKTHAHTNKSCFEPSPYCNIDDLLYQNVTNNDLMHDVPATEEQNITNLEPAEATDSAHQKNIMYCVDSENNEILFSYDTSPTDSNTPTNFQSSHYPPQMHSFSTLPNVNDIGIEPLLVGKYSVENKNRHRVGHSGKDSSSNENGQQTTYSSDDEASADSDHRHRLAAQTVNSEGLGSSVSSLGIPAREAMHLKKLVQQSHGLMCKGKRLSVSAGDLLGKTHEELVLLLIQLRRNQTKILKAKEKLESKMKKEKDGLFQIENQHYEELCSQIIHLEKQYEVTQPLVTLVDNMVKLGSLYGSSNRRSFSLPILGSYQDVPSNSNKALHPTSILSKLLEENHLQEHVREINRLEKSLQSETSSISTLHQDKEMLEHTLFGMKNKILDQQDRPAELQKLRKQQRMIEKELIRVKRLLSNSAKKIEDATSKNDQMEQEILHLRQVLQQALKNGSTEMNASHHSRADLEAELTRLQSVLDELANHRHEINNTVEKLKTESCSSRSKGTEVRASPTGVAGSAPLPLRKKHHCIYLETDLDTMMTRDLAVLWEKEFDDIPVYVNAEDITLYNEEAAPSSFEVDASESELHPLQDINEADERMKRFYGILPKEKSCEIKTVRIVKRQSERRIRERDKKKLSYDEQSSVWIMEEPELSSDDCLEIEENVIKKTHQPIEVSKPFSFHLSAASGGHQISAHDRLFGSSMSSKHGSLFQMHNTKKSKRRHYTVSGYQYLLDPQFSQYFSERPRSRDDVDMERCLRTANTPDIVRSTIKKNEVFDDKLIDREIGLPQKIDIPERYIEIEPEHLSATEKLRRSLKAENICKMLSQTTTSYEDVEKRNDSPEALYKKLSDEKRKRAHLLTLNRALAREVVDRSKAIAANVYPLENQAAS